MKVFSIRFYDVINKKEKEEFIKLIGNELMKKRFTVSLLKKEKDLKDEWENFKVSGTFGENKAELLFKGVDVETVIGYYNSDYLILEDLEGAFPEIIYFGGEVKKDKITSKTIAAVSKNSSININLPLFSPREIESITDLILEKVFEKLPNLFRKGCGRCGEDCNKMAEKIIKGEAKRSSCKQNQVGKIKIVINNKDIPLVPFVEDLFYSVLKAMLSNLKGYEEGEVQIKAKI